MHRILAFVSCGWYQLAGHLVHSFSPSSIENVPLAHVRQPFLGVPSELVCPFGHAVQTMDGGSSPTEPAGHCAKALHDPALVALSHSVLNEPKGTLTDVDPLPTTTLPRARDVQLSFPGVS